ncbi:MAG: hypothetical protein AB7O97_21775 [Planctomycetota bacterium]
MDRHRLASLGTAAAVLAAAWVVATTAYWALAAAHPLPYWDHWEFCEDLRRAAAGEYALAELVRPANEHRIAFPRALCFVDARAFSMRETALIGFALAMLLGLAALVAGLANRGRTATPQARVAAAALLIAVVASGTQIACLGWSFAPQFVAATLFPALACALIAFADPGGARPVGRAAAMVLLAVLSAACATFSIVGALLVWPVLVALALWQRTRLRLTALLAAAGAACWAVYLWNGLNRQPSVGAGVAEAVVWGLAHLGSAWQIGKWGAPVAGLFGIGLLAVHGRRVLHAAREGHGIGDRCERALLAVLCFQLLLSMAMGLGRAGMGLREALESRYAPGPLLWWAALLALQFRVLARRPPSPRWTRAAWITAALLVALLLTRQHKECSRWQSVREARELAALSVLLGEAASERCLGAYPAPELLPEKVAVLRELGISVFAPPWDRVVGEPLDRSMAIADEEPLAAPFVGHRSTSGGSRFELLRGTVGDERLRRGARLVVVDREGTVCGLGSVGWPIRAGDVVADRAVPTRGAMAWFALVPAELDEGRWFVVDDAGPRAVPMRAPRTD